MSNNTPPTLAGVGEFVGIPGRPNSGIKFKVRPPTLTVGVKVRLYREGFIDQVFTIAAAGDNIISLTQDGKTAALAAPSAEDRQIGVYLADAQPTPPADSSDKLPAGTAQLNAFRDWIAHNGGRILMAGVVLLVAMAAATLVFITGEIVNGSAALVSADSGTALQSIGQRVVIARVAGIEITPTLYNSVAALAVSAGIVAHALLLMGAKHSSGRVLNSIGLGIWIAVSLFLGAVFIALTNEARGRAFDAALVQELVNKGDNMAALVDGGRVVIAATVPLAIVSMIALTAIGSVMQRGSDAGTGKNFAHIIEVVALGFIVVASGLHAFSFGLYIGFDVFTSLAGCVIAELCFILAKVRRRWFAVVLSVIYLFLINAAAGIAAAGGLEAVRASWLSFTPELYSASPVLFGLIIAWMLADHGEANKTQATPWHIKANEAAMNVKGMREAWREALGQPSTSQIEEPKSATMGRDAPAAQIEQTAETINNGAQSESGQGSPERPKS